jgi:hypothetical protein
VPPRQQTMRATIDWSYRLLSDDERICFARFAVFTGGATVEAAQAVTAAGLDTLDRLVAKSLLVRQRTDRSPTRLAVLETVRAYAVERLARADEDAAVRELHSRYFLRLAERHGSERALDGTGRNGHVARLDSESGNIQSALAWAFAESDGERALALVAATGWHWLLRDREATLDRIDRALGLPGADRHPAVRVRVLCIKVVCQRLLGRPEQPATAAEAEAHARSLGDPVLLAQALKTRAHDETVAERWDVAAALADEAVACACAAGDDWELACALRARAAAASTASELRERIDRAARQLSRVGNTYQLTHMLASATCRALALGSDADAREFIGRALPLACALDDPFAWMSVRGALGLAALLRGETDAAENALGEALRLSARLGFRSATLTALLGLAAAAAGRGDVGRAARLTGFTAAHRHGVSPGAGLSTLQARLEANFLEPARARAGGEAWDAGVGDGAALSWEHAITYALE